MGTCICQRKNEHFSMNDLNGIEKYYSFISKRKIDILQWLINSEGPWKSPDSFLCFEEIETPIKISNDEEIQIHQLKTQTIVNINEKEEIYVDINPMNSTISINNPPLLDWPNDW